MQTFLRGFKITGIATALPASVSELRTLDEVYGQEEVERIIASTGIERVRTVPPGVCASDLCQAAAEKLLDELAPDRSTVDGVLFLSQTPDWPLPSTACALQDRLGLNRETVAMDIMYGCSAYIYGLFQAGLLVQSGVCQKVLVCAGDAISRLVNPRDKAVRMVFGDAGSATLIEKDECNPAWPFILRTDGGGGRHLIVPAGGGRQPCSRETAQETEKESGNWRAPENIYMNGMEILNFSLREVPPIVRETAEMQGWTDGELDQGAVILHQANRFMVDYLRRKMRLGIDTVPIAVAETGNTGPASIPLTLSLSKDRLRQQQRLAKTLMCGFGAGLSWGATAGDLSATMIFPPVETGKVTVHGLG